MPKLTHEFFPMFPKYSGDDIGEYLQGLAGYVDRFNDYMMQNHLRVYGDQEGEGGDLDSENLSVLSIADDEPVYAGNPANGNYFMYSKVRDRWEFYRSFEIIQGI